MFKKNQSTKILSILVLFILSRILILFILPISYSDLPYYASIGKLAAFANTQKLYLHDLINFEYPPLAAFILDILNNFIDINSVQENAYNSLYNFYYRATMLLFDCISFTILLLITSHFYPQERSKELMCSIYILSTLILLNLVYDRLDLILMTCMLACYYFQIKKSYILSALFLSLGIFLKLIPILLIPLWLLGWGVSINRKDKQFWKLQNWKYSLKAFLAFTVSNLVLTITSLIFYGSKVFKFLLYHQNRGIQIESTYSSLIQILNWFGLSYRVETSFGSQNISSTISPLLSRLSPVLIIIGIIFILIRLLRCQWDSTKENLKDDPFCFRQPEIMNNLYLSFILIILIFSKVLSTQFFILPIPFIAIYLAKKKLGLISIWMFLLCLTTLTFPYLYDSEILSKTHIGFGKPSYLGTLLILVRNTLLLYLFYNVLMDLNFLKNSIAKSLLDKINNNTSILIMGISSLLLIINFLSH